VAIDQWYQRRQKDAEGDFYRKVAGQSPQNNFNSTTQGLFVCSADGRLLGFTNHRSPERVREVLRKALEAFKPADAAPLENPKPDPNFSYRPPAGGLVVCVTARVLAGYEKPADEETRFFQDSLGRDVLWVRADEREALARGEVPASLRTRIARFTLMDFTRGEPAFWDPAELKACEMTIKEGDLTGSAHVATASGDRGFKAEIRGRVESSGGQVTRFDVVARGEAWGHSGCTGVASPKGRFTLAVAYRLASGADEADKVMPQGAKAWFPEYIGK
jgi:hypothetical protein